MNRWPIYEFSLISLISRDHAIALFCFPNKSYPFEWLTVDILSNEAWHLPLLYFKFFVLNRPYFELKGELQTKLEVSTAILRDQIDFNFWCISKTLKYTEEKGVSDRESYGRKLTLLTNSKQGKLQGVSRSWMPLGMLPVG